MVAQISNKKMTPEEYLAFEEKSNIKHEYVNGEVYAMSGSTDDHNTIAQNVAFALRTHLKNAGRSTDCRVYISDIKVQPPVSNYYYPDVVVTCDPTDRENSLLKRFPKLIVEVLSNSTEAKDRGDKFIDYQRFESLEEYVLISTKYKRVEIFRRASGGLWVLQVYQPENKEEQVIVDLKSMNLKVSLADLYEDVRLNTTESALGE